MTIYQMDFMVRRHLFFIIFFLAPLVTFGQEVKEVTDPVEWVNALIGTTESFGGIYPVIGVPWGMNYWTPQTGSMNSSKLYTYKSNKIRGFRQTHQPHAALGDYGMFSIMPVTGKLRITEEDRSCFFSHKYEICKPYYYKVYLGRYDVTTELTATTRAARFLFTFPKTDSAYLIIDAFDKGSYIKILPDKKEIIGYTTRYDFGKLKNLKNYFIIKFDKYFNVSGSWGEGQYVKGRQELKADHAIAVVRFKTEGKEKIGVKTASSFISFDQARLNLDREIGDDNFQQTESKAKSKWNEQLGRIKVLGGTDKQTRTFYSCLYRSLIFPIRLYEINKKGEIVHWSPFNGKIEQGYMFAGTGFWDTFRAQYPLLTLVYPDINIKMQKGLLNAYKEGGWLPEWSTPGYGNVMIGNNSASVIAGAYLKGLRGYNIDTLYAALIHNANNVAPGLVKGLYLGREGVEYYNKLGYIPDDVNIYASVSRTLEYAYDDFAIYQLGKKLGKPANELAIYARRCRNYTNLFDSSTGFMRGKNSNGKFISSFNPLKYGGGYVEANSWQYSWSVFHDVRGLINLLGGKNQFIKKLDTLFSTPTYEIDTNYYGASLIRETQTFNLGQYAQGNEPSHHIPYLYDYAGEPWKAQYWVREAMDHLYSPTPDGYPGDEDNGQMSAWYIFSSIGFYPVCPASDQYALGSPIFKKVVLHLQNGKKVQLIAPNNSNENRYIYSLKINDKIYTKNWISHEALLRGMRLEYKMSSAPNKNRGTKESDLPYSFSLKK